MNDLRTAAQQALEACEQRLPLKGQAEIIDELNNLRAALAEPVLNPAPGYCKHCKQYTIEEPLPAEPVQEPVAGVVLNEEGRAALVEHGREEWHCVSRNARRLYTAPPQRKPLTAEKKRALADKFLSCQPESYEVSGVFDLISAVERAHGIKE